MQQNHVSLDIFHSLFKTPPQPHPVQRVAELAAMMHDWPHPVPVLDQLAVSDIEGQNLRVAVSRLHPSPTAVEKVS